MLNFRLLLLILIGALALIICWPWGLPILVFACIFVGMQLSFPALVIMATLGSFSLASFYDSSWLWLVVLLLVGQIFISKTNSFISALTTRVMIASVLASFIFAGFAQLNLTTGTIVLLIVELIGASLLIWWLGGKRAWLKTSEREHLG